MLRRKEEEDQLQDELDALRNNTNLNKMTSKALIKKFHALKMVTFKGDEEEEAKKEKDLQCIDLDKFMKKNRKIVTGKVERDPQAT